MTIKVTKISEDLYLANLTLPDVPDVKGEWSTAEPLSAWKLVNELLAKGCHPIDISDALSEQDPKWIEKSPDRSKPTWAGGPSLSLIRRP